MTHTKPILERREAEQGFTLVELAIVLVIIGLIIGGVLVGQDMIKSAEIRSTIGQIEKYNTASNTFRDKYGWLPGDINQVRALELGFYDRTAVAAAGNGDGNGLLQACAATTAAGLLGGCETTLFWRDLNQAGFIDGYFQSADETVATVTSAAMPDWLPAAKVGHGNYITVFSAGGRNWYQVTGVTSLTAGVYALTSSLSPMESYNIDKKMDDGRPLTGGVVAMNHASVLNTTAVGAAPAVGVCVGDGSGVAAADTYNTETEPFANAYSCQLRFKFN